MLSRDDASSLPPLTDRTGGHGRILYLVRPLNDTRPVSAPIGRCATRQPEVEASFSVSVMALLTTAV